MIDKTVSLNHIKPSIKQIKEKKADISEKKDHVELGSNKEQIPEGVHKKWLFMNYIAADCNLKELQEKNIDNQELVGSDENTHIVAMIDVGPDANPLTGTWTGARTFYLNQDSKEGEIKSPVIAEFGNHVNMSDPKILTDFIVDTMKKFPSDNVLLSLNDHGGGFTGALADDTDGDFMSVPQIKQALSDAEKQTGKKIDIIGFDACLMAETEVAHGLKDNASILLASEEIEYGMGWSNNEILESSKGMTDSITMLQEALKKKINVTPEEFARIVVKHSETKQHELPTFSATDLSGINKLTSAVNGLAEAIIQSGEKEEIRTAIKSSEHYGGEGKPYEDIYDLHHIADNISKSVKDEKLRKAAEEVKKTLSDTVIAYQSDKNQYPASRGLSIYAPVDGPSYGYSDLPFAKETQWSNAMTELGKDTSSVDVKTAGPKVPDFWPDGSVRKK
jgi:hypothetical protein